jgi:hypothetical protein
MNFVLCLVDFTVLQLTTHEQYALRLCDRRRRQVQMARTFMSHTSQDTKFRAN